MNVEELKLKYAIVTDASPFKYRLWKNNKVVKTGSTDKDSEYAMIQWANGTGVAWDKVTLHDPKWKQIKKVNNANANKSGVSTSSVKFPSASNVTSKAKAQATAASSSILQKANAAVKNIAKPKLIYVRNETEFDGFRDYESDTDLILYEKIPEKFGVLSYDELTRIAKSKTVVKVVNVKKDRFINRDGYQDYIVTFKTGCFGPLQTKKTTDHKQIERGVLTASEAEQDLKRLMRIRFDSKKNV